MKKRLLHLTLVLFTLAPFSNVYSQQKKSIGEIAIPDEAKNYSAPTGAWDGLGTEDQPYLIHAPAQLAYLARQVSPYSGGCSNLCSDLH